MVEQEERLRLVELEIAAHQQRQEFYKLVLQTIQIEIKRLSESVSALDKTIATQFAEDRAKDATVRKLAIIFSVSVSTLISILGLVITVFVR